MVTSMRVPELYLRSSTPFLIYKAKQKVLTYFFQHGGQFEIQISDIFVNLKKIHDSLQYKFYLLQVSVIINFRHIFTVSIS